MKENIITKGKRNRAIARAILSNGTGIIKINSQALASFGTELSRMRISEPLVLAGELIKAIDIDVKVMGGGINGQTDAARLAIARALVGFDKKLKKTFDEYDRLLLVADVRRKEVRKPNDSKARAKRQKSYR